MAGRFHLSENGPAPCEAKPGNCPIGGDHFDNEELAIVAYEEKVEKEIHHVLDRIDEVFGGKDTEAKKWDFSEVEKLGSVDEDASIEELKELRDSLTGDAETSILRKNLTDAINRQELFNQREYGSPLEAQMASDDFLTMIGCPREINRSLRKIDENTDIGEEFSNFRRSEQVESEITDAIKSGKRVVGRFDKWSNYQYAEIENEDGSTTVLSSYRRYANIEEFSRYDYTIEGNSVRLLGAKHFNLNITQTDVDFSEHERLPDGSTVETHHYRNGSSSVLETKPNGSQIKYTLGADGKPNGNHIELDSAGKIHGRATVKDESTGNTLEINTLHGSNYCADSNGNPVPSFSRTTPDGRVHNSYKMGDKTLVDEELDKDGNIFTERAGFPVSVRDGKTGELNRFYYDNGELKSVLIDKNRKRVPFPSGSKLVKDPSSPLKYSVVDKDGSILREVDATDAFKKSEANTRIAGRNLFTSAGQSVYGRNSDIFAGKEYRVNETDPTFDLQSTASAIRNVKGPDPSPDEMRRKGFKAVG